MARTAAAGFWSLTCAGARAIGACGAFAVLFYAVALQDCRADPVKGEATLAVTGGFARLVVKLDEDISTEVSVAGAILVVRFAKPVDIALDKIAEAAPGYVGSARRDPDGMALRLSLNRKVTVNAMTAGERVFVDLLPESWSGLPPGLPQEVVRELAERARVAERALRQQRAATENKKRPAVRVRASVQPTFTRFVFELPDGSGVSSALDEQKLALSFNAPLTFDLADAKLAAPPNIGSITQKVEGDAAAVEINLIGNVNVHSFREEKNYIVDIGFEQKQKAATQVSPAPEHAAPENKSSASMRKPATEAAPASLHSEEIVQPTSETIAREAGIQQTLDDKHDAKAYMPTEPTTKTAPTPAMAAQMLVPAPSKEKTTVAVEPPVIAAPITSEAAPRAAKLQDSSAAVLAKRSSGEGLSLTFSFAVPTPAALFRRADVVWLLFDSTTLLDLDAIRKEAGADIADVTATRLEKGQALRFRLYRPLLASLAGDDKSGGNGWVVTFADTMKTTPQPLTAVRNIADPAIANVTVPLAQPGLMHKLVDPDAGDALTVVTAPVPLRGFVKRQEYVEFSLLESAHGVVVQSNAEDLAIELSTDKILLTRPGGLTLSSAKTGSDRASPASRQIFDVGEWKQNQQGDFAKRLDMLVGALAAGGDASARLDLARFYIARGMYPEAKGVLDVALADAKPGQEDATALIVHAVANILSGRPEAGLKGLASPAVGTHHDSQLWKALALARQGKWPDAREKFKNVEFAITSQPLDLQRIVLIEAMRAALEVKDYSGAGSRSADLDIIGIPSDLKPTVAVMRGRLAEALGRENDALGEYQSAAASADRRAATEARFSEIALRQKRNEITPEEMLRDLETLSFTWRGDSLEVRALQMLAKIYADAGRYGESLGAARTATVLQPNAPLSRQGQDDAAALFAQLFLSAKGDDMQPIEALALFYDYSELTPIGRRGDEMIRRLADRLVAVDLLDQASELLQYQVEQRLEGAARAQVASKLAMIHLMNRKPDRAIGALRTTRIADLAGELRQQRLLLEARAQSDIGRRDLALDIISNVGGREAVRLRSDIYWAGRQWRDSSEQIELYYGDRWRDFKPLNAVEKSDIVRAVVGYALADDAIGLARFREKYAPLMSAEDDRAVFDAAGKPSSGSSSDLARIAKMAASVDTLDGFLREMKSRFPDTAARAPLPAETQKADPISTGALPAIIGLKQADARR